MLWTIPTTILKNVEKKYSRSVNTYNDCGLITAELLVTDLDFVARAYLSLTEEEGISRDDIAE
jgi:hypothetical protein